MNIEQFETEVDSILESLPSWVKEKIDNLVVVVASRPTREQNPSGEPLLGLYEGVSLAERGFDYFAFAPDRITIFHREHMDLNLPDEDLRAEIRTTVLHELAHHLGIDDARLHELGWG